MIRGEFKPDFTSFTGIEWIMSWYSLYLSHHPGVRQQLSVSVNVIHRVFESDLLHAICLLEEPSWDMIFPSPLAERYSELTDFNVIRQQADSFGKYGHSE